MNYLWLLTIPIPLFFLWTLIHEGSHALAVLIFRGKIVEFKPYPHMFNKSFYFGRIRYTPQFVEWKRQVVAVAPYIMDLLFTIIFLAAALTSDTTITLIFCILLLGPTINTGNQMKLMLVGKECDLSKSRILGGVGLSIFILEILAFISSGIPLSF